MTAPTLDALRAAGASMVALSMKRPAMKSEAASAPPPSESSASFVVGKLAPQDAVTSSSASRHPSNPSSSSCLLFSSSLAILFSSSQGRIDTTAEEAICTISAAGGVCGRVSSNGRLSPVNGCGATSLVAAVCPICASSSWVALSMTDLSMRTSSDLVPGSAAYSCLCAASQASEPAMTPESHALAGVTSSGARIDSVAIVCDGVGLSSGPPVRPGRNGAVSIIPFFLPAHSALAAS